jgi:hypothetical protein
MQFDNGYILSLDEAAAQSYDAAVPGPVLGNGKIVMMPFVKDIDTVQTMIGGDFQLRKGQYGGNLVPAFHMNRLDFMEMSMSPSTATVRKQLLSASLNMQSGIYTGTFDILPTTVEAVEAFAQVSCDMYVLRPYPYCMMQTVRVTIPAQTQSVPVQSVPVFHRAHILPSQLERPAFSTTLIHSDSVASGPALQVLTASGILPTGATLAAATVFLMEETEDCHFELQGTNTLRNDLHQCYTKLNLTRKSGLNSSQSAGELTFRFHVLTAMMTSGDFPDPIEETKRIVLNLRNKAGTPGGVAARLRSEHVRAWSGMWSSDIHIDPKAGISEQEHARMRRHTHALRYSLYSLYSCMREGVNVDVNPMNLTVADVTGSTMTDGDLWIVPMLLLIKTDIARAMIEYKHRTISAAVQLAASYGYKGAKFPYHTDIVGYQSALYWDSVSPLYVFNTCVVAMNAWNYYRVTRDREWMFAKGYTILKHAADFIVSLAELADPTNTDPQLASRYVFKRIAGLSGIEGDDNALTVYTARIALRYALEASYDLQYPPREAWSSVYYNTQVPFFPDALNEIIRLHLDFPITSSPASAPIPIMETLVLLLPYYNAMLFGTDTRLTASTIFKNLDFYSRLVPAEYVEHPVNMLLEAAMQAQLAQTDQLYAEQMYAKLDAVLATWTDGVWGNFRSFRTLTAITNNSNTASNNNTRSNDLVLAGMYILLFLQSLGGLRIAGGVTETRFNYEEMRIKVTRAGVLPRTWRQMRIDGIGSNKAASIVINKLVYLPDTS